MLTIQSDANTQDKIYIIDCVKGQHVLAHMRLLEFFALAKFVVMGKYKLMTLTINEIQMLWKDLPFYTLIASCQISGQKVFY